MGIKTTHGILLSLLAIVVAIALTWAFIALPYWVSGLIYSSYQSDAAQDLSHGPQDEESQPYIRAFHIRTVGYASLIIVIGLIVVGILAERRGLAVAGGIAFFLPVLGHFALSMFFLSGLGLLRTIWMPLLDASYGATGDAGFGFFSLADIIFLPYITTVYLLSWVGIDARVAMGYIVMGIGLFFFVHGMLAWFITHLERKGTADFWIYRFSRHPQYLGWIVWSYGLVLYWIHEGEGTHFKISWTIPDSAPWLIATMVIIGVAMLEEIKMRRDQGAAYDSYRERTPFLLPLPGIMTKIIAAPMRGLLRKDWPENGKEVALVIVLYTVILFGLSYVYEMFDQFVVPFGRLDLFPYAYEILADRL